MNPLEARRRLLGRNVYKRTTEGNPAIAQGSLARMYPGITMQGWTEQAQYDGNQLFDASVFNGMEKSGVRVSVDNGVITASGMSERVIWIQSAYFTEEDFEKFKSGNIYVKNYKTSECNYEVGIYINNTTVKEGNSPQPIPDGYLETKPNNVYFFIDIRAGIELKGSCKPMIYQDGDGTWEPYTGGQPSPNPDYPQKIVSAGKYNEDTQKWEYEVEVGCGNLSENTLNADVVNSGITAEHVKGNVYHISGTASDLASVRVAKCELPSGTYTLSGGDGTAPSNYRFRIRALRSGDDGIKGDAYGDAFTQSIEGGMSMLYIQVPDGATVDDDVYIMLNPGSAPLPYTPYSPPQTVTLTADRPLTKWDKLTKKNGVWGWEYGSAEIVFDGSDDEAWVRYNNANGGFYVYRINTGLKNGEFYINNFQYAPNNNYMVDGSAFFRSPCYGRNVLAMRYDSADDVDSFKSFLKQNNIIFCAQTVSETFVPLSESEQEAMNALYTFRPTTVLSNDCECEMTLTYKTKKSLEVTT